LYRQGLYCADPEVIPHCADELERYGFTDHAAELRKRYAELKPVAVAPVEPVKQKKGRAKVAKKAE
jgi:hypothetical protein